MANIKVTWTQPADVGDQDSVKVYRAVGDQTALADDAFRTAATVVATESVGTASAEQSFIDLDVPTGETYTYGAFSYNAAGFGPGDIADSPITLA